jgi:mRNA interferase RelE/StbE
VQTVRYKIEYSKDVLVDLTKLTKSIRERVVKAIEQKLTVAPIEFGKPLQHKWQSHRRLRVGDYRVIYKVQEDIVVVFIVEIDHRKHVYYKYR